jgi:hypothetical protein
VHKFVKAQGSNVTGAIGRALWSCVEPQRARETSSRGSQRPVIHWRPLFVPTLATGKDSGAGVTGGSRGRRDSRGDPGSIGCYQDGKGVKPCDLLHLNFLSFYSSPHPLSHLASNWYPFETGTAVTQPWAKANSRRASLSRPKTKTAAPPPPRCTPVLSCAWDRLVECLSVNVVCVWERYSERGLRRGHDGPSIREGFSARWRWVGMVPGGRGPKGRR